MLPTVADVLALDPVKRGAPRVITGAERLDARVRWVHVIELAEAGHLLRGNELVLTTGIALPPDPAGLARYAAGLASAGVSALAVELGSRYVSALPRALVAAATAHGLPLIVFERETQFIAITEAVHAQILDAQVAELRAAERLHQIFTELAVAGASQDEIVARAAELAGVPVILADLSHRVLACAPAGHEVSSLLAGFATRSRAVTVPGRTGYDRASGWLVARVGSAGGDWARLVFVLARPPDAGEPVLAERAATTLTLAGLVRDGRGEESRERSSHRSLLAALAGRSYANPADLEPRAVALGLPLTGRMLTAVVIRLSDGDAGPGPVADALTAACKDLRVPALAGAIDDHEVAAVLALAPGADPDEALARVAARLRASVVLGPADSIGVAAGVTDVGELRNAFSDAACAAGAAAHLPTVAHDLRPFTRLADLRLAGLLYQLRSDPRVLEFAERELGPLLLHDDRHGSDLVAVLAAYLQADGNKAETAKRCGLARPTLYERLRQIERVLGASADEAGSRVALHAALLIRQVAGTDPGLRHHGERGRYRPDQQGDRRPVFR